MHGRIVDHELVRVWLVSILLGGDVFSFQTVVDSGDACSLFLFIWMHVLNITSFLYFTAFLLLFHISVIPYLPVAYHLLYPVILPD